MDGGIYTYMTYLLRYVPHFPVTAAELQKRAAAKKFSRLVDYLGELPPDQTFQDAHSVLDQLKHRMGMNK